MLRIKLRLNRHSTMRLFQDFPQGRPRAAGADARNPGEWPLHGHITYHVEAGMITRVRYV